MKVSILKRIEEDAKFLKVAAKVRYWEDSTINGESDDDGTLTPFADGEIWRPVIDIDSGVIVDWPKDVKARIHFKVCDSGSYYLLDSDKNEIARIEENYVPNGLCHGDTGYGDYIIFSVNGDGSIKDYKNKIDITDWLEE